MKQDPIALVNSDYEFVLFQDEIGELLQPKYYHTLDFMFLFMNKTPNQTLFIPKYFSDEYLRHLEDLGLSLPKFSTTEWSYNWYGKLTDLPKEKKLNSKLYSYELLNELNLNPVPNFIVSSREEISKIVKSHSLQEWYLKCPYQMGGKGFFHLKDESNFPEIERPYILEPSLNRVMDVSSFYHLDEKKNYYYTNQVTPEGKYAGGIIFANDADLENHLGSQGLGECYKEWRDSLGLIRAKIISQEIEQPFSVDGFFYKDEKGFHVHPMTEINYRQTMGGLMVSLKPFLADRGVGWFMSTKQNVDKICLNEFMPYNPDTRRGIIYLSPPASKILFLFICGTSYKETEKIRELFIRYVATLS